MENKPTYITHDLYLASALTTQNFKLIDIRKDERGRGVFVFEDQPSRQHIVRKFFSGELEGSLKNFCNVWADLRNLVTTS